MGLGTVVPVADHRGAGGLLGQADPGDAAGEGVLQVPAGAAAQDPWGPGAVAVPVAGEAEVAGAAEAEADLGRAGAAAVAEQEGAGPLDARGEVAVAVPVAGQVAVAGTETISGAGSVVRWDRERALALFEALKQDQPVDNLVDQAG